MIQHVDRSAPLAEATWLAVEATVVHVAPPRFISGIPDELHETQVSPVRRLCDLYEIATEYKVVQGNPIHDLVALTHKDDLNQLVFVRLKIGKHPNLLQKFKA